MSQRLWNFFLLCKKVLFLRIFYKAFCAFIVSSKSQIIFNLLFSSCTKFVRYYRGRLAQMVGRTLQKCLFWSLQQERVWTTLALGFFQAWWHKFPIYAWHWIFKIWCNVGHETYQGTSCKKWGVFTSEWKDFLIWEKSEEIRFCKRRLQVTPYRQGWCSCEAPSPKASNGGNSVWEEIKKPGVSFTVVFRL